MEPTEKTMFVEMSNFTEKSRILSLSNGDIKGTSGTKEHPIANEGMYCLFIVDLIM